MMTPNANESLFAEYMLRYKVSNGMKRGLPTRKPSIMSASDEGSCLAKPKSPIFHFPYFRKMLAGFRSRCTMFLFARYRHPYANWHIILPHSALSLFCE